MDYDPFGGGRMTLHRGRLIPLEISDTYIMTRNSTKITVMK